MTVFTCKFSVINKNLYFTPFHMEEGLTKCHIRPSFFSAFPNVFFYVFGLFA